MVSGRDRAKMQRIGRDLAAGQTDARGTPEQREALLAMINADRAAHGLAANRYRAPPCFTTDLDTMARPHHALVDALHRAGYEVTVFADEGEDPHPIRCHEDVVLHKLIAWRPRDRDDVRSILEAGAPLDLAYLAHRIGEWDLAERWRTFSPEA